MDDEDIASPLLQLPKDVLQSIIAWLPPTARLRLRLVNTQLCMHVSSGITSIGLGLRDATAPRVVPISERFSHLDRVSVRIKDPSARAGSKLQRHDQTHVVDTNRGMVELLSQLLRGWAAGMQLSFDILDEWNTGVVGWPNLGASRSMIVVLQQLYIFGHLASLRKLSLCLASMRFGTGTYTVTHFLSSCFSELVCVSELRLIAGDHPEAIQWIAHLRGLRNLHLRHPTPAQVAHDLPAACRNLSHLTSLEVQLSVSEPDCSIVAAGGLSVLQQLRAVSIHGNDASCLCAMLSAVRQLPNLRQLDLQDDSRICTAQDAPALQVPALSSLSQLTHLGLRSQRLGVDLLLQPSLTGLKSLRYQSETAAVVSPIQQLHLLTSLKVTSGMENLGDWHQWTALEQLYLGNTGTCHDGTILVALASLPLLKELKLGMLAWKGDEPCHELPVFRRLKSVAWGLDLTLQDSRLLAMCRAFRRAAHLYIDMRRDNLKIGADGVMPSMITTDGVAIAFRQFGHAETLQVSSIHGRADLDSVLHGLASAAAMPTVTRLCFVWCGSAVSESTVRALSAFPQLEEFDLRDWATRQSHLAYFQALAQQQLLAVHVRLSKLDIDERRPDWLDAVDNL